MNCFDSMCRLYCYHVRLCRYFQFLCWNREPLAAVAVAPRVVAVSVVLGMNREPLVAVAVAPRLVAVAVVRWMNR